MTPMLTGMGMSVQVAAMLNATTAMTSSNSYGVDRASNPETGMINLRIQATRDHIKIVSTSLKVHILRPFLLRFAFIFSAFPNDFSVWTLFAISIHVSSSSIATSNYSRSLASFLLFFALFSIQPIAFHLSPNRQFKTAISLLMWRWHSRPPCLLRAVEVSYLPFVARLAIAEKCSVLEFFPLFFIFGRSPVLFSFFPASFLLG